METEHIPFIEVRITGNNYLPGDIRSKDIGDYITYVEEMIASYLANQYEFIKKDEVLVGLSEIKQGSIDLVFKPKEELIFDTFLKISDKLENHQFHTLPQATRKQLSNILKLSRKHNSNIEFRSLNGKSTLVYEITKDTEFIEPPILEGETILYGEVIRVGGKQGATVKLVLDTGEELTCRVSVELAKQLGRFLYKEVGVIGLARWHSDTLELESFQITGITKFQGDSSIKDGVLKLRKLIGDYYEDIEDPVDYINNLRYGDEQ